MPTPFLSEDATFDGNSFHESFDGGLGGPAPDTLLDYTAYHVPGGDTTVIISSGKAAQTFDVPAVFSSVSLAIFQAAVGDTGTLSYSGGSVTATLIGVVGARREQGAFGAITYYRGALRFIS